MAQTQIKEMRHAHDAILDSLLACPFQTLAQLSADTGYSVSWLSQIIRSDCFQAEYDKRRGDLECGVMQGIGERLQALSHLAIDKLENSLEKATDAEFILDSFDRILHKTGYAPKSAPPPQAGGAAIQQNNVFFLQKDELRELQGVILNGSGTTVVPSLPELDPSECPPT